MSHDNQRQVILVCDGVEIPFLGSLTLVVDEKDKAEIASLKDLVLYRVPHVSGPLGSSLHGKTWLQFGYRWSTIGKTVISRPD